MTHPGPTHGEMPPTENIPMFSKNGTALSEAEREKIAYKRGVCVRCGIKTTEVKGFFKRVPLHTEHVHKGVCIRCSPDQVPREVYLEWETKFRPSTVSPAKAKFRAAARATAFATGLAHARHPPPEQHQQAAGGSGPTSRMDEAANHSQARVVPSAEQSQRRFDESVSSLRSAMPDQRQYEGSIRLSELSQRPFDGNMSVRSTQSELSQRPFFERSQRPFDGNDSISSIRSSLSSKGSQRPMLSIIKEPFMTEYDGESLDLSSMQHDIRRFDGSVSSEALGSRRPLETCGSFGDEQVQTPTMTNGKSLRSRESRSRESSASLSPAGSRSGSGSRRNSHESTPDKSLSEISWHNYDHEANLSARSIDPEDYSGKDSKEDIAQVMISIKENRHNPRVLKQKLCRLRNLADNDQGDAVVEIRNVLNEYRNDAMVLTAASGALWSVTSNNDDKKIEASETGAIDCILDSLRNSQTQQDPEFDEWAIGSLACLARGKGNREHIGNSDGVETILDTLRLHQVSAGIFEWCCRALHALVHEYIDEDDCADAIDRNITSIDENEGVSVIVCAMKLHYSETVAQGWAMKLLLRLMDREDGAAANHLLSQINKEDGMAACIKVLKARSTSPEVFSLAAEIMANLLVEAEAANNTDAVQSAIDCIPTVVRVMKEHDRIKSLEVSSCRLLSKLSRIEGGRAQIKETKALGGIVYAMMKYTDELTLHEAGSWTLWAMSSFPTLFNFSYVKDALSALNMSTKEFPDAPLLLAGACGFIANISSASQTNVSDIPTEILIRGLNMNRPVDIVEEQASRALTSICVRSRSKISKLFEGDGLEALVKQLRSASPKASSATCRVLAAMADNNDKNKKSLIDAGCLDGVVALLGRMNSSVGLSEALDLVIVVLAKEKEKKKHHHHRHHHVKVPSEGVSVILSKIDSLRKTPGLLVKSCDALVNLLLGTATGSSSLKLDGAVHSMSCLIDSRSYPVEVKEAACAVLWALVTKQRKHSASDLTSMFGSVVAVMKAYKGEDQPFNADLQSSAAGALGCITSRMKDSSFDISSEDVDTIIAVLYTTMEYERDRLELQEQLLEILLNLSFVNDSTVIKCGGIVVAIDAMVEHEQTESIQEVGCSILALLASTENIQVNLCIAETGGIDMIISSLATFSSNENIQVAACKALSHLSVDHETRMLIASQGGLMLVVDAMNTHRESISLLEGGCATLLNLSADVQEQVLAEAKVIETITDVMRYNPGVAQLQEKGLGVLQNLSMRTSEAKKEIAKLGGIKILVEAIHEFMGSPEVLERAFTTMWSLALLESNQKAIANAGGVELVVHGMMAQVESALVQSQACGCLCTLSSNSRNNSLIREADGVDAIVYAMWAHYNSAAVQSEACRALSSVAVDLHTNEVIIAQDGEMNAIIAAMRRFPDSPKLQENACVALRNLLLSPDSVDSVSYLADDIRAVVTAAADRHEERCGDCANQVLAQLF